MDIVLTRRLPSGIIFGELEAPYESERVRAIEELLQIRGFISAIQTISGKRCGVNSG